MAVSNALRHRLAGALAHRSAGTEARQLLDVTSGAPAGVTYTIGTEAANVINVAMQLTDEAGDNLAIAASVQIYLSSDTAGQTVATAPTGGFAIGTDGTILTEFTANLHAQVVCETDGDIDIDITDTGTPTMYLNTILPNGKIVTSGAITFA